MTSRSIASVVLAATLAAAGIAPLSTAASAGEWNGRGHYDHDYRRDWHRDGRFYDYRRHDHFGRNVAIGAAATILGLAIAAEATRDYGYRYYGDRY